MLPRRLCPRFRLPIRFTFAACVLAVLTPQIAAKEETWLRVTAPEFTVITSLPEKAAVAWAGEFSQFVAALQGFLPVQPNRLPRLTIVVFARSREFREYRPLDRSGRPKDVAGFFSRRDSWAVAGLAAGGLAEHTRRTIFHEGTHWFLTAWDLPNPVWLEEGLAEVFSTFATDRKTFSWGRAIEDHVLALNFSQTMPLERLLFLTEADLFVDGEEGETRTGLAYAQSWVFVHYLIFGQREVPLKALTNYVHALRGSSHPDEAFQKAFGQTYEEMDRKLLSYVTGGQYYVVSRPLLPIPALRAEPATTAEIEDALARLSLAARRGPQALAHAEKAAAAGDEAPACHDLLGQVHQELGDKAKAQEAYARAVELGSRDFRSHFELACTRHESAVQEDGSPRTLAPLEARRIASGYERAINLNPRFRAAYEALAGVIELVPPGNAQDTAFLEQGLMLFPDDGLIRLGLAVIARRDGDTGKARKLLNEVLESASPQPMHIRAYASRLDSSWQQADIFERLAALAGEKKFTEALALAETGLADIRDNFARQRLHDLRRDLRHMQRVEAVRTAWEVHDWAEARRLLNEILDSDAPPQLKLQLRRRLEELGGRGLSLPTQEPATTLADAPAPGS